MCQDEKVGEYSAELRVGKQKKQLKRGMPRTL